MVDMRIWTDCRPDLIRPFHSFDLPRWGPIYLISPTFFLSKLILLKLNMAGQIFWSFSGFGRFRMRKRGVFGRKLWGPLTANLFVALRKIILPLAIHPMSDKIMEITTLAPDGSSLLVVWHFWLTELKTSDSGGQGFTDKGRSCTHLCTPVLFSTA